MNKLGQIHESYVHRRRITRLCQHLSELIPKNAQILDVGCGDGRLAGLLQESRSDIKIQGIDIMIREKNYIPVKEFDGKNIPYETNSFDVVMFVDVLHHTLDPLILLREAARVTKKFVIMKDHTNEGFLSNLTLRFMDWAGNKPHGVVLPYNYWREYQWKQSFQNLGMEISLWKKDLQLYPVWADLFFGRDLHFIARLETN